MMMESGEPLAGRRSEFMSTRRSSHRVASRTLDLERRLRVLSAHVVTAFSSTEIPQLVNPFAPFLRSSSFIAAVYPPRPRFGDPLAPHDARHHVHAGLSFLPLLFKSQR